MAAVVLAIVAAFSVIKIWPRANEGGGTAKDALCWGALSRAQTKPLLSTDRPVTATETAPDVAEATCDVRTGDHLKDIQFVLWLRDGTVGSVTPPEGIERLKGNRTGWATQAQGRIRLSDSCADALHRTTSSHVDLLLSTTTQVRKHYDWKSAVLVPRVSQVLTEAAEGIERHYKCGST
ncbi:hypothetical protein [Streptomyces sp. NBC_00996]|uniref:hypothetical protein n=1 Tax=Streptomyces sp. NBC_00996 TaxID=2903710 RepID=UPI00386D9191|nr:hypothetical protein OG390_37370 [Streptomyces sp. NBC_00996]